MTALASPFPSRLGSEIATIMVKELRSRMRGRRAFVVLTVYLALLALITYAVYLVAAPQVAPGFGGPQSAQASAIVGQSIFLVLSIFQLILVCFIAPAFTAGQISLEREKQTLDLLVSTPIRPAAIVLGKLGAALAFVVLMIVAAVPITAIVLMYGGVAVDDIIRQQVVLLATAGLLGAIGLFFSALLKRTQAATVLTYITMLALTLGTTMLFGFWTIIVSQQPTIGVPHRAPEQILYLNPGIAMLDVIAPAEPGFGGGVTQMLNDIRGAGPGFQPGAEVDCGPGPCPPGVDVGRPVDAFGQPVDVAAGYWWPRIVITYLLVGIALTFASTRLVEPAGMRSIRRRRAPLDATWPIDPSARDDATNGIEDIPGAER